MTPGLESSDLEFIQFRNGLASSHTRFRQLRDGRPIFGTLVSVHQDGQGKVHTVHSSIQAAGSDTSRTDPKLTAAEAEAVARLTAGKIVGHPAELRLPTVSELVWFPLSEDA